MERDENKIGILRRMIEENPIGFASMLRSRENEGLSEYVENWCSSFMTGEHKFSTKCWYAINSLGDYVRCKACGRPITRDVFTLSRPQLEYCCQKCAYGSSERAEKIRTGHLSMSDEQRIEKTRRMKATKLEKYGDENYTNREKAVKTYEERYGKDVTNPGQAPEVKIVIAETMAERYGGHFTRTEEYVILKL